MGVECSQRRSDTRTFSFLKDEFQESEMHRKLKLSLKTPDRRERKSSQRIKGQSRKVKKYINHSNTNNGRV